MVFLDSPVANATAETPPHPIDKASVAAHCRRERSSNSDDIALNFFLTNGIIFLFRKKEL